MLHDTEALSIIWGPKIAACSTAAQPWVIGYNGEVAQLCNQCNSAPIYARRLD